MTTSIRRKFFGAFAYGAFILAVVPLFASLMFVCAAVGAERFNRNLTVLNKHLKDAKLAIDAANAAA